MVECNLAKVEVAGSNLVSRSSDQGPELIGSGLFNPPLDCDADDLPAQIPNAGITQW